MKKILALVICMMVVLSSGILLAGCGSKEESAEKTGGSSLKKVGIVQIVEHPSLNSIRESLIKELAAKGYEDGKNISIDYQNAQGDQTNLKSICQKFANNKYDLIIAIATPSAQAAVGETKTIPVLFSACTDPLGAGLVADMNKPGGNVTGTSDAVSAEKIMGLAEKITPGIKTIGALYNSSETNSVSVINGLKKYAATKGITVVEATVTNSSEVQQAAQSLASKTDAIFSPIDNTVASAMPVVTQVVRAAKKPVYVGADSMVKDGGLATYGINYIVLGKETGDMAAEILAGKNPGEMPVKTMSEMNIYINKETADAIGVKIPDDIMKQAAQVFGQ